MNPTETDDNRGCLRTNPGTCHFKATEVRVDDLVERLRDVDRNPPNLQERRQIADELARLSRELAEARRDAARYRWLRDKSPAKWKIDVGDLPVFKFDLNAAIDAAMAASLAPGPAE